jgi:hypothetical protein
MRVETPAAKTIEAAISMETSMHMKLEELLHRPLSTLARAGTWPPHPREFTNHLSFGGVTHSSSCGAASSQEHQQQPHGHGFGDVSVQNHQWQSHVDGMGDVSA